MKIKVEHISNTFNYGSLMMAINTLKFIKKHIPESKFFVDCSSDEDLKRLVKETEIQDITFAKKYDQQNRNKFKKILKKIHINKEESEFYDLKIVLGGDDISEYYGRKSWLIQFPIMWLNNISLPTILLGQTIGPFTSYRRLLAKFSLNKAIVYTRDDSCLRYIKKMGINNARAGRDLAFLDLPIQSQAINILSKFKLNKDQYITIVPSGLTKWYTDEYQDYLKEQYAIIKNILEYDNLKDKSIVLLPHVILPESVDDRNVIRDIKKLLTYTELERVIVIEESMLASEAREILGNGLFTITGRMHAAVSTFYMRKPAISLSYSVKYEGVIGSGLDMNELVIECANEDLWATSKVSKQVAKKIEYVNEHYEELINKIDRNVSKTSDMSIKQLESVVQDIRAIQQKRKKYR